MGSVAGDQPAEPTQDAPGVIQLAPAATVFHDTLERNYPHYPKIEDISLTNTEMVACSIFISLKIVRKFCITTTWSFVQYIWLDLLIGIHTS